MRSIQCLKLLRCQCQCPARRRSLTDPAPAQRHLAIFGELAGIAQQVEQDLPQPHGIDGDGTKVILDLDNQAVLVLLGELACGANRRGA
jgi:hypothetical protein